MALEVRHLIVWGKIFRLGQENISVTLTVNTKEGTDGQKLKKISWKASVHQKGQ